MLTLCLQTDLALTVCAPLRANSRLAEANSKLLNERSRSLLAGSIANGSLAGPSLDMGSHYGASLGPLNRSLGLSFSLLSPGSEGQNSRVEDYLAKVRTLWGASSLRAHSHSHVMTSCPECCFLYCVCVS